MGINSRSQNGIEIILKSENTGNYQVNVYDLLSMHVYNSKVSAGAGRAPVNIKFNVKSQTYIVRVSDGQRINAKKVINVK